MRIKDRLKDVITEAMRSASIRDEDLSEPVLEKPKLKEHGDIATPVALVLARKLRRNPTEIAESIVAAADFPKDVVASVSIAAPGFINMTLSGEVLRRTLVDVHSSGDRYGSSDVGRGRKWQVEYISANPTGPLVVVSARAAAVGSVLVNLLSFTGYEAHGEYYVNDYGKQVEALGESLRYRLRERLGTLESGEEIGAYPGEYLKDLADEIPERDASGWVDPARKTGAELGRYATDRILDSIRNDLDRFGVTFHNFFHESALHPRGVHETLELFKGKGCTYEKEGALYFKSSDFGDDKDRVLVKSNGEATYFLGDVAYHHDKLRRGYEGVIDIWGPDHHGHIKRMQAASGVLGAPPGWLEVMIVGWVRLVEGGKPVGMSKRAGEFVTMRELVEDVGKDAAKYFFLMRRANSPLDFDLELARKQSEENPVYYVQYAHARIASVIRYAGDNGVVSSDRRLDLLERGEERDLMLHLLFFPHVVEASARMREPHRMTVYAQELASLFHQFYHNCRIVSGNADLSSARLFLVEATKQVLKNALTLLGVDAPASM